MSQETRIAKMKQKGEVEQLAYMLNYESEWMIRLDAAEALVQMKDKRGLDYLINALDDPDQEIRDVASEILEELNDPQGNDALKQLHKPITVDSQPKKKSGWYSRTAIVIIVVSVFCVFLDSFSWDSGGMNGIYSMMVVFLAVIVLIIVSAVALVTNVIQSNSNESNFKLKDNQKLPTSNVTEGVNATAIREATQTTSESPKKVPSSSIPSNWKKRLPILVPIIFSLISILIVAIYSIRSSRESYGNWDRAPHPGGSKISEIISSDTRMVIVKAESGIIYIASPEYCEIGGTIYLDCWHTDIETWNFIEDDAINDQSCPGKARPPEAPVKRIGEEIVFRNCSFGSTKEIRLFISEDGDLWYWNEYLTTSSDIFTMAIYMSCLVVPISALIGALLVWILFKIRDKRLHTQ